MVLVNQRKDSLFNFNNIQCLWIEKEDAGVVAIYAMGEIIGIYRTEERAKEVLQEIVNYYNHENAKTFYLPKE